MIKQAEKERGLKYRWVIRTRPDIRFTKQLPKPEAWPLGNKAMQNEQPHKIDMLAFIFGDQYAIMGRKAAEIQLSAFPYVSG